MQIIAAGILRALFLHCSAKKPYGAIANASVRGLSRLIKSISPCRRAMKVAHGILFETIRQLEDQGIHVPQSLRRSFVLLHSYILVRRDSGMDVTR